MTKKVVIFDLDGTLADTAHLTDGRRVPADVLKLSKPWESQPSLLMHHDLKRQIDWLIASKIKVYVITRAPKSYASTLIFLLGIDFHALIPSSTRFKTVESKLEYIIEFESVAPSEVLYIGNEDDDEEAAITVGIPYQHIDEVFGLRKNYRNHLQVLVELCEYADEYDSKSAIIIREKQDENIEWVNKILETVSSTSETPNFDRSKLLSTLLPQIFCSHPRDDEFFKSDVIKPFINPSFISRYEYDTNTDTREIFLNFLTQLGFAAKLITTPFKVPNNFIRGDISVNCHYSYDDMKHWWAYIKDWKWPNSGPHVQMLHLEFIALTMAASISKLSKKSVIVPIPPTEFSKSKPSETSLRLAYRVAQLSSVPVFSMFKKDSDDNIFTEYSGTKFDRTIILLDDQLTKGESALKCLNLLSEMGFDDVCLHTWTSKKFELRGEVPW
jgi:phosphoglycolate phosphatase-like HAD superfamily hydrolase